MSLCVYRINTRINLPSDLGCLPVNDAGRIGACWLLLRELNRTREVGKLHDTFLVDQEVVRTHISVRDALRLQIGQRMQDL